MLLEGEATGKQPDRSGSTKSGLCNTESKDHAWFCISAHFFLRTAGTPPIAMINVAIQVVNYNTKVYLIRCLDDILKTCQTVTSVSS